MPCPICGDACNCTPPYHAGRQSRTRFRPGAKPSDEHESRLGITTEDSVLLDPETHGDTDQQFSAGLKLPSATSNPRFIVAGLTATEEPDLSSIELSQAPREPGLTKSPDLEAENRIVLDADTAEGPASQNPVAECDSDGMNAPQLPLPPEEWRQELAARLHNYHSRRRRRPPRYPSLSLKFDPPENTRSGSLHSSELGHTLSAFHGGGRADSATAVARQELASATATAEPRFEPCNLTLDSTNVLEFPRPFLPPPVTGNELADPIRDKPRILDAPETVSQQVPLGGIILEAQDPVPRPDLELPLQVAPLSLRLTASLTDVAFVLIATGMFAAIFLRLSPSAAPSRSLLGLEIFLLASLWAIYQYLFLVHTGSTPGLQLVGLTVSRFAGGPPSRGSRRCRALAMALSALSVGLGFLWCLLDADTLCWHDRITHTYLTRSTGAPSSFVKIQRTLKQTLRNFPASFMAGLRIRS